MLSNPHAISLGLVESVAVFNQNTRKTILRYGLTPRQAVLYCHAESQNSSDTTLYETKFGRLVEYDKFTVSCGNFVSFHIEP